MTLNLLCGCWLIGTGTPPIWQVNQPTLKMMSSFLCNFLSSSVCICILLGLDLVLCRYKDHSPHVWAVVLDQEDHKSVAESVGLTSLGKVFSDVHEFRLSSEQHASLRQQLGHDDAVVEHVHNTVTSHPSVIWAEFQKPIKRVIRGEDGEDSDHRESHTVITFNDPSYSQQWHLVRKQMMTWFMVTNQNTSYLMCIRMCLIE